MRAIGVGYLLVEFEGVAKCMQAFRLLGVGVSKGLRGGFEEVLVVTHLGYWHAVELVCRVGGLKKICIFKNGICHQ